MESCKACCVALGGCASHKVPAAATGVAGAAAVPKSRNLRRCHACGCHKCPGKSRVGCNAPATALAAWAAAHGNAPPRHLRTSKLRRCVRCAVVCWVPAPVAAPAAAAHAAAAAAPAAAASAAAAAAPAAAASAGPTPPGEDDEDEETGASDEDVSGETEEVEEVDDSDDDSDDDCDSE